MIGLKRRLDHKTSCRCQLNLLKSSNVCGQLVSVHRDDEIRQHPHLAPILGGSRSFWRSFKGGKPDPEDEDD